jgi:hypothetical protein
VRNASLGAMCPLVLAVDWSDSWHSRTRSFSVHTLDCADAVAGGAADSHGMMDEYVVTASAIAPVFS